MKVGRRLAIKILNASKFVLGVAGDADETGEVTAPLDRAMLASARRASSTRRPPRSTDYDYARALERTERFFWGFCDDYVELVKQRAYGDGDETRRRLGARRAPARARHRAPAVRAAPAVRDRRGVVVVAARARCTARPWPERTALAAHAGDPAVYDVAAEVLGAVRKAKTGQQRSLRTEVQRLVVRDTAERLAALEAATGDVREAARSSAGIETSTAAEFAVDVELAAPDAA